MKGTIETTELEDREGIFAQIDKLEKEVLEKYEKALDDVLPQAFAIVKDTARRFSENPELVVTATDFDRELALFVVLSAPFACLCDSPDEYRKYPDILKYLAEVPTSWDQTIPLAACVGEYAVLAKQKGNTWYE